LNHESRDQEVVRVELCNPEIARGQLCAEAKSNVGRWLYCGKRAVLRNRDWIHDRLRAARGEGETGMIETGLLGLVTILLLIYLVYALLRPEKF
jgi:K+-transporting ATPase KdpF subunit